MGSMSVAAGLSSLARKRLQCAGAYLFAPKTVLRSDFCEQLDKKGLKQAFLRVITEFHPSRHGRGSGN